MYFSVTPKKIMMITGAALLVVGCQATPKGPFEGLSASTSPQQEATEQLGSSKIPLSRPGSSLEGSDQKGYRAFAPKPTGRKTRIDYEVFDDALNLMIYSSGRSLRKRAQRPPPPIGSRMVVGHDSAFRLEGNKVFFSQFDQDTKDSIVEYRQSLEEIGNSVDIASLSKGEQLAYWTNLHNMVVIEQIAINYPMKEPYRIRSGPAGEQLDEAKLVTINGVPLSLYDIRVNIVYRYWDDPDVIYGFFRGDLGSPNIQPFAYTSKNTSSLLKRSGREFVNSLRGVRKGRRAIVISPVYEEARPYFFPDWPNDLKMHLQEFADDDVKKILSADQPFSIGTYETRVADLAGGQLRASKTNIQSGPQVANGLTVPSHMARLMQEFSLKQRELKLRYGARGRVVIIDLPTADDIRKTKKTDENEKDDEK